MKIYLPVSLFLMSIFFNCQTPKKEENTNQKLMVDFYLRYLQEDKQVKAEISFAVLDSIEKIKPKRMKEVLFQNKALDGKIIRNQFKYGITTQATFSPEYAFQYSTVDGMSKTKNISILPLEQFSIKEKKIHKSKGCTLNFSTKKLSANESLILLFNNKNNLTKTIALAGPSSDLSIFIPPAQLKELTVGEGILYIVRKQRIEETSAEEQLIGITEYYSNTLDVSIAE